MTVLGLKELTFTWQSSLSAVQQAGYVPIAIYVRKNFTQETSQKNEK